MAAEAGAEVKLRVVVGMEKGERAGAGAEAGEAAGVTLATAAGEV